MRLSFLLAAVCLLPACGGFDDSAAFGDSFQDDDIPMGGCQGTACPETTAGDSAAGAGQPCDGTNQCAQGVCAAPFADGEAGELVCQTTCIAAGDEMMWCSDSAACCDLDATCGSRGFCEQPEGLDDTGASADSGTSSSSSGTGADGTDTDGTDADAGTTAGESSGSGGRESGATTSGTDS